MEKFFGESPAKVVWKLAIASVIIGVVLTNFDVDLNRLLDAIQRFLSSFGLDLVKRILNYLLLGAVIVVPLWFLSRILSVFSSREKQK
jgi:uncharacterized protein DUF6460